jgi:uncharacterized protein
VNRVYWDSMLFIYLLEGNREFGGRVVRLYEAMQRRNDVLCTGVFTVGEVLTGPRKRNDLTGTQIIKEFFAGKEVEILPFGIDSADRYSMIRAAENVSQADAIHMATAAVAGVELFVTNDRKLRTLLVPGIKFFADLDGKLY